MFSETIYCTYLTIYKGNKLPPFYIGSTIVDKINKNYHGSVSSREYKKIWKSEIKSNPHLFKTIILTKHKLQKESILKELHFQIKLNVVKSSLYINLSYARPNGFFGRTDQVSIKGTFCWTNGEVDIYRKEHPGEGWIKGNCEKTKLSKSNGIRKKGKEHHNYGRVRGVQANERFVAAVSKNYIATFPDGRIEKINGLKEFCIKNNLDTAGAHRVMNGTQKHYKNFIFRKEL